MQLLLGLFFSSILLTTGSSMECKKCLEINKPCPDTKEQCSSETDVCMEMGLKSKDDKDQISVKGCTAKNDCKQYKDQIGKTLPKKIEGVPDGAVIKDVTCSSKAPPSFASFFPAFLGLLLMKLLF